MSLTKSKPNNLTRPSGNTLYIYLDEPSGVPMLIDILGNIAPLEDFIGALQNTGSGAKIYKEGSSNPNLLRTLVQGSNILIEEKEDVIEISIPSLTGVPLYLGAFCSTQTQTSAGNEEKKITYNTTQIGNQGVLLQNGSEILIQNAGKYNIQHSIQMVRTQGGGSSDFYLWLVKNGSPVPNTNTKLTFENNNHFQFAAWNFFVTAAANDVYELAWYSTSEHVELHYSAPAIVGMPAIPSIILTVNRIG